ncbi:MAG TPA: hypothetical protein VE981_24165 [Planctomycetota bacterium]|nr:hypothetical protein [Planctomycetota bacterium]
MKPQTGLHPTAKVLVKLEPSPNRGGRYASDTGPSVDSNWANAMPKLIPACQKWMREQLPK